MVESLSDKDIYMFCYGCNNPKELSKRVGSDVDGLRKRTYAAEAKGWRRGYTGISKEFGGASVATIEQTGKDDDSVIGIVVKLTEKEVEALDPYEGYPQWYERIKINLAVYKKNDSN